jgi:predicted murein hydrolase (TIGR00659 family)
MITIFSIILTISLYVISRKIYLKTQNAFFTPILICTISIIFILHLMGISFEQYKPGKELMTFLLGPATVGLALPLYLNRKILLASLFPILSGIVIGSLSTLTCAVLLAKLSGLDSVIIKSIATKSITAPIAIEVAHITGGDPALSVAFVMFTGILGATVGAIFLNFCRIKDPVARGLAMGVTSHGLGTAAILQEGKTQGAMSGIAMGLSAVFISIIIPIYLPWLLRIF